MTNPSVDPYDVPGRHVWDAEEVSPLGYGSARPHCTEEQAHRRNRVYNEVTSITPAELLQGEYGDEAGAR